MSCYTLQPHDPELCTVRVGYDAGRESFYAYVARPILIVRGKTAEGKDGHVIEMPGLEGAQIRTVAELEEVVSAYATVTTSVRESLLEDQRRAETSAGAAGREMGIAVGKET